MTGDDEETVEPKAGGEISKQEITKGDSGDYLSKARYGLTEDEIHSRANVRHLMARSDQLDVVRRELNTLQKQYAELDKNYAVLVEKSHRDRLAQTLSTFCISSGFAASGYAISFLTAAPAGGERSLPIIFTIIGLIVAIGGLFYQFKTKA